MPPERTVASTRRAASAGRGRSNRTCGGHRRDPRRRGPRDRPRPHAAPGRGGGRRSRTRSAASSPRTCARTPTCRPSTARPWTATRCAPPTWRTRRSCSRSRARSAPGSTPTVRSPPGQAVQVMTGAPVPAGATAVQPVEKTRARDGGAPGGDPGGGGRRRPHRAPGMRGARRATSCSSAGRAIDPATIAVLAAVGKARVQVGRRPDGGRPRHRRRAGGRVGHAGPRPHPQQQRLRGDGAGALARGRRRGRWASSPTRPTASRTRCGRASRRTCW